MCSIRWHSSRWDPPTGSGSPQHLVGSGELEVLFASHHEHEQWRLVWLVRTRLGPQHVVFSAAPRKGRVKVEIKRAVTNGGIEIDGSHLPPRPRRRIREKKNWLWYPTCHEAEKYLTCLMYIPPTNCFTPPSCSFFVPKQTAFYFAWMNFYFRWLLVPAIVGLLVTVHKVN